ncbi:hypothetical protein SNE40_003983 [Patella caerulea]|uniref:DUF19 domain-containing protein n=1 Tax=Patella caerulea TaxID=87958 RepID=A0AAN8K413_PATCE
MSLKVFLFVSLMGVTKVANGQGFYDLGHCRTFNYDTNQCMAEYSVLPDIQNLVKAHLQNLHMLNASIVCSYKTEYISLITCIRDAIGKCVSDEFNSLFPSDKVHTANILYFCRMSKYFDYKCFVDIAQENMNCIWKHFNVADIPKRDDGFKKWKDFTCRIQEITHDCLIHQKSGSCRSTFKIMKKLNSIIALPVCSKFSVTADNPYMKVIPDNNNV